jgi:hypothetical protein
MGSLHAFVDTQLLHTIGRWLERHSSLATLALAGMLLALGYWHFTIAPYLASARAAASCKDESPPSLPAEGTAFPAGRLLELPVPTPFGSWLLPHLLRRDLTQSQLALQLGVPVDWVFALMFGPLAGSSPSPAKLVEAICEALELDPAEGRAALCGSPAGRPGRPSVGRE